MFNRSLFIHFFQFDFGCTTYNTRVVAEGDRRSKNTTLVDIQYGT
jgi:hypothetical protein